jgi:hypothetical protein
MFDDIDPAVCDQLDRTRGRWAVALNLVAPGSGLIILRQDRRGLTIAAVFAGLAVPGIWGFWILPGILPTTLATACLLLSVTVWSISQCWVWRRRTAVLGSRARSQTTAWCAAADEAASERQFARSEALLRRALESNDEDPVPWAQWARLLVVMGRVEQARQAWESTLDVDKTGKFRREGIMAIERLPDPPDERRGLTGRSTTPAS